MPLCVVPATAAAPWSAPARTAGCSATLAAAPAPSVVFPSASPAVRSGPGALLWTAPRGCTTGSSDVTTGEAFGATLATDDLPGAGRALAPEGGGLADIAAAAGTALGQVVALGPAQSTGADTGVLAEGKIAGAFGAALPLGGPAAPVAASSAYLGDVAFASPARTATGWEIAVRVQRHYSKSLARARLVPVGASPIEAVAATMDYRAEVLLVWASGGAVYARQLAAAGALGSTRRLGSFTAGSPDPELRALVSDDGHAIVAWRNQSASAGTRTTTIELSISGGGLAFGAPRVLERFRDLGGFVPPAGSLGLLRLSSEAVMIAWTGVDAGRYVVRASPVSLHRGAWAPVVISDPGGTGGQTGAGRSAGAGEQTSAGRPVAPRRPTGAAGATAASDAVLTDIAAGPDAEAFAVWRTAPSSANGAPRSRRWTIRAARGHYAGQGEVAFTAPELVAAPGPNGPPAVAVDPASGRALAAWVSLAGASGTGRIEYALRAAGPASALPPSVASLTHTARRITGHSGHELVVGLSVLTVLALAGALLIVVPRRPRHMPARRG